jgi:hypothetical protein
MFNHDDYNKKNRSGAQGLDSPWFGVNYDNSDQEVAINLTQVQAFNADVQPGTEGDDDEREVKLKLWMIGGNVIELSIHQGGYGWFLSAVNNYRSGTNGSHGPENQKQTT